MTYKQAKENFNYWLTGFKKAKDIKISEDGKLSFKVCIPIKKQDWRFGYETAKKG